MKQLTLQWHITEQCNLRCSHCYQDSFLKPETPFYRIIEVLNNFIRFIPQWQNALQLSSSKVHINFTGGEPMLHSQFSEIIETVSENRDKLSFGILTNGTLITESTAKLLRAAGVSFVQISVEGDEETHDEIRGKGSFKLVKQALKILKDNKIRVFISFTANSDNYTKFAKAASLGRRYGVAKVWADRMVPVCNDVKAPATLNWTQSSDFFKIMKKEQGRFVFRNSTEVEMGRALMFLESKKHPYKCSAGNTLLALLPDGSMYPCRRLPIKMGNIFETDFAELYFNRNPYNEIARTDNIEVCSRCSCACMCRGGAKCITYAVFGRLNMPDPACPFIK